MKILAMYLPQFHRVKENDEWWGEGFTDWISTRNAKPL
jgi:lipopolysaccharide biosynthesis protein